MTRVAKNPSWRLLLACAVLFYTTVFAGVINLAARDHIKRHCLTVKCAPYTLLASTEEYELREYAAGTFPTVTAPNNLTAMKILLMDYLYGNNVAGKEYFQDNYPMFTLYKDPYLNLVFYYPHANYPNAIDPRIILKSYPKMKIYVRATSADYPIRELLSTLDKGLYAYSVIYSNDYYFADEIGVLAKG